MNENKTKNKEMTYYDSVTGKPVFIAPRGRTHDEFIEETQRIGWLSFTEREVVWENVRCMVSGEVVGVNGSHLGHLIPQNDEVRYVISLVSVAGYPWKN